MSDIPLVPPPDQQEPEPDPLQSEAWVRDIPFVPVLAFVMLIAFFLIYAFVLT